MIVYCVSLLIFTNTDIVRNHINDDM